MHVITSLDVGGAERALVRLVQEASGTIETLAVASLIGGGTLSADIEAAGIPVHDLGLRSGWDSVRAARRLHSLLRELRPEVVHTWMHHADLLGGLVARAARVPGVAWNLRATRLPADAYSRGTRSLIRVNALLSRWVPDVITCVADASRRDHVALGYDRRKMTVVPNGIPRPHVPPGTRDDVRRQLGAAPQDVLIGRIARFHPMKDYPTLIRAAGILRHSHPAVRWVLCGDHVTTENPDLRRWIRDERVGDRIDLLGPRADVHRIHAAVDLACSSSAHSEGFPGVVAEAMAAGIPVVATDVGDSAHIVGETGRIVPPGDADALARAIGDLVDDGPLRRRCGTAAQERVRTEFGLDRMVARYAATYEGIR